MKNFLALTTLFMIAFVMTGCGNTQFTQQRFDTMVKPGQTKAQVLKTLGEPVFIHKNKWKWRVEKTMATGTVYFDKNGKVIRKQWQGYRAPAKPAGKTKPAPNPDKVIPPDVRTPALR